MQLMRKETEEGTEEVTSDEPSVVSLDTASTVDEASESSAESSPEPIETPADEREPEEPRPKETPDPEESLDSEETFAPEETFDPDKPTYRIHKLHLPQLDVRERRPLLEITRKSYLEIVRQAAEKWKAAKEDEFLIDQSSPPRASPRATPSTWKRSFAQFRAFFFKLAETIPIPLLNRPPPRGDPD